MQWARPVALRGLNGQKEQAPSTSSSEARPGILKLQVGLCMKQYRTDLITPLGSDNSGLDSVALLTQHARSRPTPLLLFWKKRERHTYKKPQDQGSTKLCLIDQPSANVAIETVHSWYLMGRATNSSAKQNHEGWGSSQETNSNIPLKIFDKLCHNRDFKVWGEIFRFGLIVCISFPNLESMS